MHTNAVATALKSISLGQSLVVDNLTMIPLVRRPHLDTSVSGLDYTVLDDALESGSFEITEISEQGSVPDLRVVNRGSQPVLIVDGEELLGAKQNRVVNLSILVPAHTELTIPVSCVEAGRWRARTRSFISAPRAQYATGRAKRMAQVSFSMKVRGERVSDQAEVWQDIAEISDRLSAESPTAAMEAIFHLHGVSIDQYVERCRPVDDQVGAVFAVGGTLIGLDLFDRPSTLRKVLPKLVRSVAVDAIDASARSERARPPHDAVHARAEQFLAVAADAPQHVTPALGLGEDARITAPGLAGAALVLDHHVVHFSAFAL